MNAPSGRPDVSYIMAAHNAEPFIAAAIGSALAQEEAEVEVIVADDASGDATCPVVEEIAARDRRVRLVRLTRNGGPSAARNAAIAAASGDWIAVLDADDLLQSWRTRRLLDLAASLRADIVADNLERFDESGVLSTLLPASTTPYAFEIEPAGYLANNVIIGGSAPGLGYLKPMFRRGLLGRLPGPYVESLRLGEDFVLSLEAITLGARYAAESKAGYRYRVRAGSASHRLTSDHVAALRAWSDAYAARTDLPASEDFRLALETYRRSLAHAGAFIALVDDLKARRFGSAARMAGRKRALWPLLMRHGAEALGKRVARRASGPRPA